MYMLNESCVVSLTVSSHDAFCLNCIMHVTGLLDFDRKYNVWTLNSCGCYWMHARGHSCVLMTLFFHNSHVSLYCVQSQHHLRDHLGDGLCWGLALTKRVSLVDICLVDRSISRIPSFSCSMCNVDVVYTWIIKCHIRSLLLSGVGLLGLLCCVLRQYDSFLQNLFILTTVLLVNRSDANRDCMDLYFYEGHLRLNYVSF